MKRVIQLVVLCALLVHATVASAGCGCFLRRGGCSDTCISGMCGGHHAASCSRCGHVGSGGYEVSSVASGAVYYGGASSGCNGNCSSGTSVATQSYSSAHTGCAHCGGVMSAPTTSLSQQVWSSSMGVSGSSAVTQNLDCGPVASYQVVMETKYVTETKLVPTTEYRDEVRVRTRTVSRQVPVEVQDYRTTTVLVPKTEVKTIEYTVLVPNQGEKSVDIVETVPVWNEISESYTVKVPNVIDVPEEYTVTVPVLRDEQFSYTVYVPQTQTQTKMHTFTNVVPVSKTRTVQVSRPVTTMKTVTRDYGHWEVRVEEAAAAVSPAYAGDSGNYAIAIGGCGVGPSYGDSSSCGACGGSGHMQTTCAAGCRVASSCRHCGGCGLRRHRHAAAGCSSGCGAAGISGGMSYGYSAGGSCGADVGSGTVSYAGTAGYAAPASQTVSHRVWVPNVVTEEVPVTEMTSETQEVSYTAFEQKSEQIPYECTYVVYAPESRTGTRKVVDYASETRTRTRKVVQYAEETRTRTRKELTYKQETRTEKVPYVSYSTEKRTKEVSYTVNVPESKVEPFTTTRFDTIQEEVAEEYTVRTPFLSSKEVQVQVCKMVPKLVPVTIYPCSASGQGMATGATAPATTTYSTPSYSVGVPTVAPALHPAAGCGNGQCLMNSCPNCSN